MCTATISRSELTKALQGANNHNDDVRTIEIEKPLLTDEELTPFVQLLHAVLKTE